MRAEPLWLFSMLLVLVLGPALAQDQSQDGPDAIAPAAREILRNCRDPLFINCFKEWYPGIEKNRVKNRPQPPPGPPPAPQKQAPSPEQPEGALDVVTDQQKPEPPEADDKKPEAKPAPETKTTPETKPAPET
ncbi:MAG: hypothetical protein WCK65_10120, partial [Rhodospirillaceae bacterium]